MSSIFTKIIAGEIPCYKVAETDRFIAFLDVNPNAPGHTLCVPKQEADKLFDLAQKDYLDLMEFARLVAKALERAVPCKRVGMSVIGLEVPHVHVHLIPLQTMADITFGKKVTQSEAQMTAIAQAIGDHM
jgi:histidine triad (HIT) family protein